MASASRKQHLLSLCSHVGALFAYWLAGRWTMTIRAAESGEGPCIVKSLESECALLGKDMLLAGKGFRT